ncbi:MAG: chromosomal replication initiator protein DnaA [Fibrobacterales bacterium]
MPSVDKMLIDVCQEDFWGSCLSKIEQEVTAQQYHTWFDSLKFIKIEQNTLFLSVEGSFIADWIQSNYHNMLLGAAQSLDESVLYLDFTVEAPERVNVTPAPGIAQKTLREIPVVHDILQAPHEMRQSGRRVQQEGINRHYTFDQFVKAENNELIYVASKNVAQAPGRNSVNPLIIYGGTGMGKTHLLHAIGNYAIRHQTAQKVLYRTSDRFISDFISKVSKKDTQESFFNTYKDVDILLIDDIQFLSNKKQTQEEFFKIFETLRQMNKQIVITCDKDPNEVEGLNERLINRFSSGLAAPVLPTNYETRLEILKKKISSDPCMKHFSIEILQFIAEKFTTNIRELEGALTRLFAYSSLMGRDLSLEAAKSVLMGVASKQKGKISIPSIIDTVATEFDLESDVLCSQSRLKTVAVPRKLAMYLSRHITGSTLHTIAAHFNRDYSTVIHAIKSLEKELTHNAVLNHKMQKLKAYLKK